MGGGIPLGQAGGQCAGQHVDRDGDGKHNQCGGHAVAADPEGPGAEGAFEAKGQSAFRRAVFPDGMTLWQLHSLHLRFSRDCTLKNRKSPMMVRK